MKGGDVANSTPSMSRVVLLGACLVAFSAFLLLLAPLGYRLGFLSLRFALLTVLRWGAYVAIAGAALSVAGLVITVLRPRLVRRGAALSVISIVAALTLIAIPGRFRFGPQAPPIHDITTDTQDPPEYVAVQPLRANAPNTTVYGGEKIATEQRRAYPDIQPLRLPDPPARAFERALAAAREMGWELVEANPAEGRIEATDTTFWFGFKDDVVIRVTAADGGSRVDVRSLSRVGGGDAGTNAKRIRKYVEVLHQKRAAGGESNMPQAPPATSGKIEKLEKPKSEWKKILPPDVYAVLFEGRTERAFSSPLDNEKGPGTFVCAACYLPLFTSDTKFDSGTGWPSFYKPIEASVGTKRDYWLVVPRTEYHCIRCGGHQGHVFNDGPPPTGQRWCNNGLALKFFPKGQPLPTLRT
jgi:peptide-methionine (R)-S-oxide reductase